MTSSINPNNIDGAYPVAGQDNNSQGFRDNFTNIRTNFGYAANEITDLQNKVVLKQALTGTTLDNDMGGNILKNAQLQDISQTTVTLDTGFGSRIIDYSAGSYYAMDMIGAVTLSFANFPATGKLGVVRLQATVLANQTVTITFPSTLSSLNASNIVGMIDNVLSFPVLSTNETYVFEIWTTSSLGTANPLFIRDLTRGNYSGSDSVSNGDACSLKTTVSYFSTSIVESSTLAAGVAGQVKTLLMKAGGGDMAVTVTNPGWSTDSTALVTITGVGTSCTLQSVPVNGTECRWFCIGNNGAVFS